jgi:signal transduction histidine kinase
METPEIIILITLSCGIVLTFIIGLLVFIFQYRKRKIFYNMEKINLAHQYEREREQATLAMQEITMQDIGREIHDGVGQRLTLASIYTKQLLIKNISEETKLHVEEINSIINESINQLRSLSKEPTTETNVEVDLEKLYAEEVTKMRNLNLCTISYQAPGSIWLPNKKAMFLVRILQEFLQNSLKHASCTHIQVNLELMLTTLRIEIHDNGIGFDRQEPSKGIGLLNMKRRAQMIEADLNLNSTPGQGTSLTLLLELK